MNDFDPVVFLSPVLAIIASILLLLIIRKKSNLRAVVIVFALISYAAAIALKEIVQYFSLIFIYNHFGKMSILTGLYFGIQTSIFEVIGAYLIALLVARKALISERDADAYGGSLAFWENAVLLGALPLFSLLVDYFLIASGSALGSLVYSELKASDPGLFYSPLSVLPDVLLGALERLSSILAHYSWGFLTLSAVVLKKKKLLYIAIPMGLIDALVPFEPLMGIDLFEGVVFAFSVFFLFIAIHYRKIYLKGAGSENPPNIQ
ncbi:MAG: hypothetical protein M1595_03770 [Candidatus Thermoplasmatota archaeon]|jgi:hypothetical protein|nr:hypothetical protein [Candidatus Thermoplasmatota archaeon]